MYKFLYPICTSWDNSRIVNKYLLIMKLTLVLLITSCLQITFANDSYSQRISLSEKNSSIVEVFRQIRKQSGYDFLYTTSLINNAKPVSIQVKCVAGNGA
jgi:hypothetical protein